MLRPTRTLTAVMWLVGTLAACGENVVQLPPVEITPVWDTSVLGGCPSDRCEDYPAPCDAMVSVRIVSARTGELLEDRCERVQGAATACTLFDVGQPAFFDIPPEMVQIQIAAWRAEVLLNDPELQGACPTEDIFDLQGVPRTDFVPQPAFGGAAYFDSTSSVTELAVPLACTDPGQMNDATECSVLETLVIALLDDMERGLPIEEKAATQLAVEVGRPITELVDGVTTYLIDQSDKLLLQPGPSFQDFIDKPLDGTVCIIENQTNAAPVYFIVSCEESEQTDADRLTLSGNHLPNSVVNQIVAATGKPFPNEGLVIGRVVDENGLPLGGVTVSASKGSIQYLNFARDQLIGVQTSSNGYFISSDADFTSTWTARSNVDGRREVGSETYIAGKIRSKVTTLVIEMGPPP